MRIYKLFVINRTKKHTRSSKPFLCIYQALLVFLGVNYLKLKKMVMKLELVQIFAARIVLSLAGRSSQARI